MIIVDSREKKWQHIEKYFQQHGILYQIQKLDIADYMLEGQDKFVIDRKQNLDELCSNLCTKDSGRFWREVRRSREQKVKMVILCEHGGKIKSIKDVAEWKSTYSRVTGRHLAAEIYRVHIAYGVEFLFCDKRSTGRRILELLEDTAWIEKR